MNTTHSSIRSSACRNLTVPRYPNAAGREYFLNKLADAVLCAASTLGVVTALFFLLTM